MSSQAEHEAQRVRNAELVKMQEESAVKQEQMRRATEAEVRGRVNPKSKRGNNLRESKEQGSQFVRVGRC